MRRAKDHRGNPLPITDHDRAIIAEARQELAAMSKANYVRAQPQTRAHTCHWTGCGKQVPPAMWGCKTHWFRLPIRLRTAIWRAYVPGQEARMDPSAEYLRVADEVQQWIRENAASFETKARA